MWWLTLLAFPAAGVAAAINPLIGVLVFIGSIIWILKNIWETDEEWRKMDKSDYRFKIEKEESQEND